MQQEDHEACWWKKPSGAHGATHRKKLRRKKNKTDLNHDFLIMSDFYDFL